MADTAKTQKPKRDTKVKFLQITQQLTPEYWDWASDRSERKSRDGTIIDNRLGLTLDEARDLIENGTAHDITEYVIKRLEHVGDLFGAPDKDGMHPGAVVISAYAIIHDLDEVEAWDERLGESVKVPKARHIHIVLVFKGETQATYKSGNVAYLAKRVGVEAQYLEKPRPGGNPVEVAEQKVSQSYDNMLAYLTHVKYPEKHVYDPSDVATVRGTDFASIYWERYADWLKGRAHVKKKRATANFEDVLDKVLMGELSMEQVLLSNDLFEVYSRHMREIEEAFVAFGKRRAMRAAVDIKAGKFETQIVYFAGANGSGKSKTAEWFADELVARAALFGLRWGVHEAASRNAMDDYAGEEILMMDEARSNAMGAADWLLLMNPEKASPASARYKNKGKVAPRLIVITNTTHPYEYFYYVREKGDIDEAMGQFIRRLSLLVTVVAEHLDTPDETRRYFMQRVQSIVPRKETLKTRDGFVDFEIDRGFTSRIEHSLKGVKAALALDFASRSRDIPFDQGDDWLALEDLVAEEIEVHETLAAIEAADREARGPFDPWDIPGMASAPAYAG